MKLSTKGRYAVMAMVDLASIAREKPVALAERYYQDGADAAGPGGFLMRQPGIFHDFPREI